MTQGVFVAFAKNARQLTDRSVFSGWLHRTAQNIAAQTVRTIERRRAREQEAVAMNELLAHEPDAAWENIAPHLDAALGELSEPDRDALLLRYFERKSAREMAQILNVSEEAAQKRVNRAVERLREFFSKRNVTIGASGLVVLISTNAVQAAPDRIFATISSAVTASTITIATHTTMHWLNLKSAAAILAATVTVGTVTHFARQGEAHRLRSENQNLLAQQKLLTSEVEAASLKSGEAELSLKDKNELIRLRGEVGLLQRQAAEFEKLANKGLRTETSAPVAQNRALEEDPDFLTFKKTLAAMKTISLAAGFYARENKDEFPTDLNQLAKLPWKPNPFDAGIDLGLFELLPIPLPPNRALTWTKLLLVNAPPGEPRMGNGGVFMALLMVAALLSNFRLTVTLKLGRTSTGCWHPD